MRNLMFASTALLSLTAQMCLAGEAAFSAKPVASKKGDNVEISFALSKATDVEVAVVDAKGKVVRHLAAGVLGGKTPPPAPLKAGLSQKLEWDGKDDFGDKAKGGPFHVRVRAGMGVQLKNLVGGNPYLYFMGSHGDHGPWGINGLEAKSDGKVYVLGASSQLGPAALRQYDADGNYIKTVFPPPAGKDPQSMAAWGIHNRKDGTYTIRFNCVKTPAPGLTVLNTRGMGIGRLLPTPEPGTLSAWMTGKNPRRSASFQTMTLNTDGTIPPKEQQMQGQLVQTPRVKPGKAAPLGPVFVCPAPDGKSFYLSGVYGVAQDPKNWRKVQPEKDGFWRDGQVWKVDYEARTAKPFFALDKEAVNKTWKDRKGTLGGVHSYAALHGVAVDKAGHVFVCNRVEHCVMVLDKDAKVIRKIPVKNPDAIAVSVRTGAMFVTTRYGCERSGKGQVGLVKFNDWRKDDKPSTVLSKLCKTWFTGNHKHSYVALCEKKDVTNVWVAYTEIPVRIYEDKGAALKLVKDFRRLSDPQAYPGPYVRMVVDRDRNEAYLSDRHYRYWKVGDWASPKFVRVPVKAQSLAIGPRNRLLYANAGGSVWAKPGGIARYRLTDGGCTPANTPGGGNVLTSKLYSEWIFAGTDDLGFDVALNGNIAGLDEKNRLYFWSGKEEKAPWSAKLLVDYRKSRVGCVQFDLGGNLYVGCRAGGPARIPPVFKDDPYASQRDAYKGCARIVKYAPTGDLKSGNLFPAPPKAPAKAYDVNFGAFEKGDGPRFSVDEYGRICYPITLEPSVRLMDNAGNQILAFGTYGNRDSMGGLPGDTVPTKGIPVAYPNSVDVTDDYVYVADSVNLRMMRIAKTFAATKTAQIK